MFELTLRLNFERQKYFSEFYKALFPEIKSDNGIIIKHNNLGNSYLSIAVSDEKKDYLKSKVLDFVTKLIEKEFKYKFFKSRIVITSQKNLTEAFLEAISIFDEEIDKQIISENIDLNGELIIESLFYFKLQNLVKKWEKTAEIINKNFIMNSENSMTEVLRYLCTISENNSVFVDLNFHNEQITLTNFMFKKKYKRDFNGISNLFAEIIKLNPIKINIKTQDNLDEQNEITSTLVKLFNDKIYFV